MAKKKGISHKKSDRPSRFRKQVEAAKAARGQMETSHPQRSGSQQVNASDSEPEKRSHRLEMPKGLRQKGRLTANVWRAKRRREDNRKLASPRSFEQKFRDYQEVRAIIQDRRRYGV
jgi:hypothetical protein